MRRALLALLLAMAACGGASSPPAKPGIDRAPPFRPLGWALKGGSCPPGMICMPARYADEIGSYQRERELELYLYRVYNRCRVEK